jgi:hypothetical protein
MKYSERGATTMTMLICSQHAAIKMCVCVCGVWCRDNDFPSRINVVLLRGEFPAAAAARTQIQGLQ